MGIAIADTGKYVGFEPETYTAALHYFKGEGIVPDWAKEVEQISRLLIQG